MKICNSRKGFTLIELLVVIAIIAILAAILFPVFAQAKQSAKKAVCVSNAKQWNLAMIMYETDADDKFPVWMATGSFDVDAVPHDYDLLNGLNPYIKNEEMSRTPADPFTIASREINNNFPNPLTKVGASIQAQKLYNVGWLSDYGINYWMMGALWTQTAPGMGQFQAAPVSTNFIAQPAATISYVTGIFNRTPGGQQTDGGQLAIDQPCLYTPDGSAFNVVPAPSNSNNQLWYYGGWNPSQPLAWNVFGGVWPYYMNNATTGFMDGHVKVLSIGALSAGCNVLNGSGGRVTDQDKYLWDQF